jgi:glycosyltransferase involved in cell wall biosynthesis
MNEKAIIFDGQVFQSAAWDRGMGKYSLGLLRSMIAHNSYAYSHTVIIFTEHMKLSNEAEKILKKAAPKAEFVFLDLKVPKNHPGENIRPLHEHNKSVLDEYLKTMSLTDSTFMILSLFPDQLASVFPSMTKKVLLFYDLIPLQYSEKYGLAPSFKGYLDRYNILFDAEVILTISQTVADDLILYVGIDPDTVFNIDGAAIERDGKSIIKPPGFKDGPYILMPSGNDIRKNNYRAVQAFKEYRDRSGDGVTRLILTSHYDEDTMSQLRGISPNVEFVGNVSEAELRWLYEHTEALLFVSEYEGLGLPMLEAAEVDIPVVCSNLTVFSEMSPTAFYYSDQHNPSDIARALDAALNRRDFAMKKREYPDILSRYTWPATAAKALKVLIKDASVTKNGPKARIAVFAPNPAGYSAIGKVVMLMHHALDEQFDIDYYVEDGRSRQNFARASYLSSVAKVYPASEFTAVKYMDYDAVFYHVGNSEYHIETIKNALHLPGYIIMHDTKLKGVFEEVLYRFGYIGEKRLAAERKLNELMHSTKTAYTTSLVNNQLGIITHSNYANDALASVIKQDVPVHTAALPVGTPAMKRIKAENEPFKIGFGGIIHKSKGLGIVDDLLNAGELGDAEIYIFGVPLIESGILERLESQPNVHIEKNLTDFAFENRLAEMDVIVSYRPDYNGETSLTVLEAMRHGVVPIVRSVGWFEELPDECVQKVHGENEVTASILALKKNPLLLAEKSRAAKDYTRHMHSYKAYVKAMLSVIDKTQGVATGNRKVAVALKNGTSKSQIVDELKK